MQQAAAMRPHRIFLWRLKGLQIWNRTSSPVRLIRAADTV